MKVQDLLENDLDRYRLSALKFIKSHTSKWKVEAASILGKPVTGVKAIGSVTNKNKFTENSDVDVAFYVRSPGEDDGMSEELSEKLQGHYVRHPFPAIGVINTIVYVRNE